MYVIGFNGPPRSGKDTAAGMLACLLAENVKTPFIVEHLSSPLRRIAYEMCGLRYDDCGLEYEDFKKMHFEEFKRSGRQLMIDVSESFLKPQYGQGIMAQMCINRNNAFDGIMILADCGFRVESEELQHAYGTKNVLVVQVNREGATFDGDSREWVHADGGHNAVIHNNGSLDDLSTEVRRIYGRLQNQYKWVL